MDRAAVRLDDEPPVGLAPDRRDAGSPSWSCAPGPLGQADEPREPLARVEQAARVDGQPAVVRRRADLVGEALARDDPSRRAPLGADRGLVRELVGVRPRRGELHVAVEPELRLDARIPDRPPEELRGLHGIRGRAAVPSSRP